MAGIAIETIIILCLIVINGVFAMAEMAIVSSRKSRLEHRALDGDRGSRAALDLSENPNRFLSTVQIGITLIGVLAGAFGGATIAEQLSDVLSAYPGLAPYGEAIGIAAVVSVVTFLTLIIGELVPKRIALNRPEAIAAALARPMHWLSVAAKPIVHLLSATTDVMLRLLHIEPIEDAAVTEEEIEIILEQGARAGVIYEAEHDILERVLRFADQTIAAFMTPRTEVSCIEITDPPERVREKLLEQSQLHYVVCRGSLDNPVGVLDIREVARASLAGEPLQLERMLIQPHFVPESAPALSVLERFRSKGDQIALVVNEYGGIEGVVTLSDILEAFIGEIALPGETFEESIVQREDGSYLVDGLLSSEEFKDEFELRELKGEDSGSFRTVGGFVVNFFGHIPHAGDVFEFGPYRIEVVDMDGKRVDKILLSPLTSEEA
jgi:putative hemolysin